MRRTWELVTLGILIVSCVLLAGTANTFGQQASNGQATLTLKQVKQRLNQNKNYLKTAEKRGKAGDAAGLQTALNNYDRGMEGLNTALSQGQIQGSPSQQQDAYNRVQTATQKHLNVLEGLLNNPKIPAQGKAGINKAIAASQKGQQTALSHLSQLQAQQGMGQANRPGSGQSQGMGRSEGMGRPGGAGGFGAANSPMGAPMGGGMGHPGGGPPMGGGGHPGR